MSTSRPLLLDLFCGAGGCAVGYHRAGFDVIGVDIKPQPNYPFAFMQQDALPVFETAVRDLSPAAIHASPPCQGYLNLSAVNRSMGRPQEHERLIAATRAWLLGSDLPYVIENVADAGSEPLEPVRVCGTGLGLPLRRHRLFESNVPLGAWRASTSGSACLGTGRAGARTVSTDWRPSCRSTATLVVVRSGQRQWASTG